jgi:hypothetical protein
MKSPLHELSRVAMLDIDEALVGGSLITPYSALRITAWISK